MIGGWVRKQACSDSGSKRPGTPAEFVGRFKNYYGPTMNAFEAADKSGRVADLQRQLEDLFKTQNKSSRKDMTSIPATFLRVTVTL